MREGEGGRRSQPRSDFFLDPRLKLDKIVKTTLRKQGFHGKQASDERLYERREDGGRGLKSFKEVYDETKVRVTCYVATSNNEWSKVSWRTTT